MNIDEYETIQAVSRELVRQIAPGMTVSVQRSPDYLRFEITVETDKDGQHYGVTQYVEDREFSPDIVKEKIREAVDKLKHYGKSTH